MSKPSNILWWILGGIAVMGLAIAGWQSVIKPFLSEWESFSSVPYWDFKQWSWGYGTRVPGSIDSKSVKPQGTITKTRAMQDSLGILQGNYNTLKAQVTTPLNKNQWAALLSFSYNTGVGSALKLVPEINSQDWPSLETHWKKYIYAGGVIQDGLIDRRNAEWDLFSS